MSCIDGIKKFIQNLGPEDEMGNSKIPTDFFMKRSCFRGMVDYYKNNYKPWNEIWVNSRKRDEKLMR